MDAISYKKHQQDNRTPYQGEKHTYDPKSIFNSLSAMDGHDHPLTN